MSHKFKANSYTPACDYMKVVHAQLHYDTDCNVYFGKARLSWQSCKVTSQLMMTVPQKSIPVTTCTGNLTMIRPTVIV